MERETEEEAEEGVSNEVNSLESTLCGKLAPAAARPLSVPSALLSRKHTLWAEWDPSFFFLKDLYILNNVAAANEIPLLDLVPSYRNGNLFPFWNKNPTVLVSWKKVMWAPKQCFPKELFRWYWLYICGLAFCANVRTLRKGTCFLTARCQIRNTKKCSAREINRITREDGQGRLWVGGESISIMPHLECSFIKALQVSESSLILRSQAGGWAQNFQKSPWCPNNPGTVSIHRNPCVPSRRCCTKAEFQDLHRGSLNCWEEVAQTGSLRIVMRPWRLRNTLHPIKKPNLLLYLDNCFPP